MRKYQRSIREQLIHKFCLPFDFIFNYWAFFFHLINYWPVWIQLRCPPRPISCWVISWILMSVTSSCSRTIVTSWQNRALEVLPEVHSGVPRGPNNRLRMSNDLRHSYVPFHPVPGGSLPLPSSGALMAHWGSEAFIVLGVPQKRLRIYCHTCSQLWTWREYSSNTGVFGLKCPNPAKSG